MAQAVGTSENPSSAVLRPVTRIYGRIRLQCQFLPGLPRPCFVCGLIYRASFGVPPIFGRAEAL
jgi:hypothetical protein